MDELTNNTSDGWPIDSVETVLPDETMNINIDDMQIRTETTKPTQQHEHSLHDKHSNFLHFLDFDG